MPCGNNTERHALQEIHKRSVDENVAQNIAAKCKYTSSINHIDRSLCTAVIFTTITEFMSSIFLF